MHIPTSDGSRASGASAAAGRLALAVWLLASPLAPHRACRADPAAAVPPATRPAPAPAPKADTATDWLLGHATTAPSDDKPSDAKSSDDGRPPARVSKPASPFTPPAAGGAKDSDSSKASKDAPGVCRGVLLLSNGEKVRGKWATTAGKPLRVYDEHEVYRDIPFELVKSAEAKVIWERDEREWHFKESGSDVKEYSGKTYPARETQYVLTLVNGQTVTGAIVAPLYLQLPDGQATFVLHKRDKGEPGQTLKQLVYVQKAEFEQDPHDGAGEPAK